MKIDLKLLRIMGIAAGIIILFIIIIALFSSCVKNKKYTIDELENKLITLSKSYYNKNKDSLPNEGESTTLSTGHFISSGYFKELKLTSGATCTGEIIVTNNNGYYLYLPKLTCGNDIKPVTFVNQIKEDNLVKTGEGLYEYGSTYLFRGENIKNYLHFNDKIWRIIKINADDTIRIIENKKSESSTWDNRYNLDKKSNTGINDFVANNINSRIKNKLEEIYNKEQFFSDEVKAYFSKQDLCIGKRAETDTNNDGTIECSNLIKDQVLGLIQVNEYLQASLDENCTTTSSISCTNYNFLAKLESNTWTLTADKDSSFKVFKLDYGLSLANASNTSGIAIAVNLSPNLLYKSGTGTLNDPYIIK
ncbi:MAG: hypothetical protein PHF21_02405 [Bacilli bacterium]|nr:hypothetical protein [Bacilli bacterium]